MSWKVITTDDCRLTPAEEAALAGIQGTASVKGAVLTNVIREFVGAIRAAGGPVATDDTIPDVIRNHVIARTRWLWLTEFPALKAYATDARKEANKAAEEFLARLLDGKVNVDPVSDATTTSANWNGENRLAMRGHPVPRRAAQADGDYANDDAPSDAGP